MLGLVAISVSTGLFEAYLRRHGDDLRVAGVAQAFPVGILLFAWCKADAAHRGVKEPTGAALLVGLLAPVGVPYYYLRILSPGDALLRIAGAAGVFVLMAVVTAAVFALACRVCPI
jgi:hypothetical protein